MVSVYGSEIRTGFTSIGSTGEYYTELYAIYTYGCKVWPETESWTGPWPGPEVHPGDYFIDWTPSNITGVFSIAGRNYYLQDYSGHYEFEGTEGTITSKAFSNNSDILTLNTTASRVESSAFLNCNIMTSATLSHCSYIGFGAFALCLNLSSVSLPECTWIEDRAFYDNTMLSTVSLPKVTYVGQSAFASCRSLGYVYLGPDCSMIASSAFHSVGYSLQGYTSYTLAYRGEGVVAISGSLGNLGRLTVPAWKRDLYTYLVTQEWQSLRSMVYVKYYDNMSRLQDVEYFDTAQLSARIGTTSYLETDALGIVSSTSLIGVERASLSQVRYIGSEVFISCSGLQDLYAPNISSIYTRALAGTALPYIVLSHCEYIGIEAFSGCSSLSYVILGGSSVCSLYSRAFSGCSSLQNIYVPSSLVTAYQTASNWSAYSDIIQPL